MSVAIRIPSLPNFAWRGGCFLLMYQQKQNPHERPFGPCGGWWIRLSHIFPCFFPLFTALRAVWGMFPSHVSAKQNPHERPFGPCGGWWIRFAIIISSAEMIIIGIDQCLHWSKRYATGISHLDGFESHHPSPTKPKTQTLRSGFGLLRLPEMNRVLPVMNYLFKESQRSSVHRVYKMEHLSS